MSILVTGATGFVSSRVVNELIKNGHRLLGLSRSYAGDKAMKDAGAEVQRGQLEDPASLPSGAKRAEGVIHRALFMISRNFRKTAPSIRAQLKH